jgi:acetyl-CoA acyltransferase
MNEAVILACVRSPMTKAKKGALAKARIDDVAAQVLEGLMSRFPEIDRDEIEDVMIGCATPEGEQGVNVARNIALLAGIPVGVGAQTINRFCASSLTAIGSAARSVMVGEGELFVAGGIESMSHVPMTGFNPSLNEGLMTGEAPDAYIGMGMTAENVANRYDVSREDQDRYALMSHRKAFSAQTQGKFDNEIMPIEIVGRDGQRDIVEADDCPRSDTSIEILSSLKPAFLDGGTVTAGNASPLSDGAAMLLISSKKFAKRMKIKPLARIRGTAVVGVDPSEMGMAPADAVPKLLSRLKMRLSNIDLVEINEAFAAPTIAVMRRLGVDEKKVNIHGGAIALGHPLGMSGARIVTTLVHSMLDRGAATGLATMCVGGGQGVAMVLERV